MSGIIGDMFKQMPFGKFGVAPKLLQNEIVIEITEDQFKNMVLEGADPRIKNNVHIQLLNGKIVIKIKLF